jgi:hypothetical protein
MIVRLILAFLFAARAFAPAFADRLDAYDAKRHADQGRGGGLG